MSDKTVRHHEYCDSVGLGPGLEPSTKPCNCGTVSDKTVEGVMGLAIEFANRIASGYGDERTQARDALKAAITALAAERDQAVAKRDECKRFYKELVEDFLPFNECLPECDSYGHADECPVHNAQVSMRKMKDERDQAVKENIKLKIEMQQILLDDPCEAERDALKAERDSERLMRRQAQEDFGAALNAAEKDRDISNNALLLETAMAKKMEAERDALKAQLKESQEFVKNLRDDVRRLNSEDVRF